MTQDMKSTFAGLGFGNNPFAWPKGGAAIPGIGDWLRIQQDMATAAMEFGQRAIETVQADAKLGSEAVQRLMLAKTPEDFSAWQRDVFELMSSRYIEQWTKFGEQMQGAFAKTLASAKTPMPEPEAAIKPKKAA